VVTTSSALKYAGPKSYREDLSVKDERNGSAFITR